MWTKYKENKATAAAVATTNDDETMFYLRKVIVYTQKKCCEAEFLSSTILFGKQFTFLQLI